MIFYQSTASKTLARNLWKSFGESLGVLEVLYEDVEKEGKASNSVDIFRGYVQMRVLDLTSLYLDTSAGVVYRSSRRTNRGIVRSMAARVCTMWPLRIGEAATENEPKEASAMK